MKRSETVCLLLVLLLAAVGCGSGDMPTAEAASSAETFTEATAAETKDPHYETDLAVRDFGGDTFMIAINNNPNIHHTVVPEAEDGDTLNDALYRRNSKIAEKYHIELSETEVDFTDTAPVKNAVIAGDDIYDLVMLTCPDALSWWKEGLLIPFDDVPHINLEKGYWDKSINDSLSIGGIQYIAEGAFNLDIYDLTFCLLFNKTLCAQYDLPDLYQAVSEGAWTYDMMKTTMQTVVADINGDGTMNDADRWGYTAHPKMVAPGFWIGGGVTSISKDKDDIPYISMKEESFVNVWNRIFDVIHESDAAFLTHGDEKDIPTECRLIFEEDRSLYMDMSFFYINAMRDMETDFGIIPYPKYDAAQTDYHARVCYYFPTVIPTTNNDLDKTGYLLEILNYESYHSVIPAYYDVALKTKNARDEESAAMLDLIFDSRVIDIGDSTLCDIIRDNFIYQMFEKENIELVSRVERQEKNIIKRLEIMTE